MYKKVAILLALMLSNSFPGVEIIESDATISILAYLGAKGIWKIGSLLINSLYKTFVSPKFVNIGLRTLMTLAKSIYQVVGHGTRTIAGRFINFLKESYNSLQKYKDKREIPRNVFRPIYEGLKDRFNRIYQKYKEEEPYGEEVKRPNRDWQQQNGPRENAEWSKKVRDAYARIAEGIRKGKELRFYTCTLPIDRNHMESLVNLYFKDRSRRKLEKDRREYHDEAELDGFDEEPCPPGYHNPLRTGTYGQAYKIKKSSDVKGNESTGLARNISKVVSAV